MKKVLVVITMMVVLGMNVFGGDNIVNVNINTSDLTITRDKTVLGFGFGLTTPIMGTYKELSIAGKTYTKSVTGINCMFGFTNRNYLGDGLTSNSGAGYFEIGTLMIFMPFIGVGYDYKIGDNVIIGIGLPDILHGSIVF